MKNATLIVQDIEIDRQTQQQLLQELRDAVSDLRSVNPQAGLLRFVSLGLATIGLTVLTWQTDQTSWFVLGAIATGIVYAFWLICNHDATHRTLTGWNWFDAVMPRLAAWPMLLPSGTYNQIHQLHHGQNGIELSDPERVQWTDQEYRAASPLKRWYVNRQWAIDILILGSFGLMVKTLSHGLKLQRYLPKLRQQIMMDAAGMLSAQTIIISLCLVQSVSLGRYLLFWILLEWGIGFVLQLRDHIEHYGLWQQVGNYQLTQLYACRNIKTFPWMNWLMGGLPYHAVHHAFPQIPSYSLPTAFERIQSVLQRYSLPPMVFDPGYAATSIALGRHLDLISEQPSCPYPQERQDKLKTNRLKFA